MYQRGRPTWLRHGRREFALPADVQGDALRALAVARRVGEPDEAIPADRVELVAGRELPVLLVPPGEYVVTVRSSADEELLTERVSVE